MKLYSLFLFFVHIMLNACDTRLTIKPSKQNFLKDIIFNQFIEQIKENPNDEENKKILIYLATDFPHLIKNHFFNLQFEKQLGNMHFVVGGFYNLWSSHEECTVSRSVNNCLTIINNYFFKNEKYTPSITGEWLHESFNGKSFAGIYKDEDKKQYIYMYQTNNKEYRFAKPNAQRIKCSRLNLNLLYVITDSKLEKYHLTTGEFLQQCTLPEMPKPKRFRLYETSNHSQYVLLHPTFGIWLFNADEFIIGKQLPFKAMRCKTNKTGTLVAFANIIEGIPTGEIRICSSVNLENIIQKIDIGLYQFPKTMRFICDDKYLIIGTQHIDFGKITVFNRENGEKYFETEEGKIITHAPINIFPHTDDTVYIRNGDRGCFSLSFPLLLAYERTKQEAQMDINNN